MDAAKTNGQQKGSTKQQQVNKFTIMTVILLLTNTPSRAWIYKNVEWKSEFLIFLLNTARKCSYQKVIKDGEIERFITLDSFCNFSFIFIKHILSYQQILLGCTVKLVFRRVKDITEALWELLLNSQWVHNTCHQMRSPLILVPSQDAYVYRKWLWRSITPPSDKDKNTTSLVASRCWPVYVTDNITITSFVSIFAQVVIVWFFFLSLCSHSGVISWIVSWSKQDQICKYLFGTYCGYVFTAPVRSLIHH